MDFATTDIMDRQTHIRQGLFIGLVDNRHTRCLNGTKPHTNGQVCQYCQYKTIRPSPLRKKYKNLDHQLYPNHKSNHNLLSHIDNQIFDIKQQSLQKYRQNNNQNNSSIINRYTPKKKNRVQHDTIQ